MPVEAFPWSYIQLYCHVAHLLCLHTLQVAVGLNKELDPVVLQSTKAFLSPVFLHYRKQASFSLHDLPWVPMGKFSSVQLLSRVRLFATPWTAAHQASLSITSSRSLLKLMSIKWVMPSNHLILCRPLLLPPSIFPSVRIFANKSVLCIRWPKYCSFSFSISTSNEYSRLISFRVGSFKQLQIREGNGCRDNGGAV